MKKITAAIILILHVLFIHGQNFSYPVLKSYGNHVTDFIPDGWHILDSVSGDLNKDETPDYVFVLEYKDSAEIPRTSFGYADTIKAKPRILAIYLYSNFSNAFNLYIQSNSFILEHDNPQMEEPLQKLEITNGILKIGFQFFAYAGTYWVSSYTYKWRYGNGVFVLIGVDTDEFSRASHDYTEYSYNLVTGKWSKTIGNDDKGSRKTEWHQFPGSQIQTFKTFPRPLTWEITKGQYL